MFSGHFALVPQKWFVRSEPTANEEVRANELNIGHFVDVFFDTSLLLCALIRLARLHLVQISHRNDSS